MGRSVRDAGVALGVSVLVCVALASYAGLALAQGAAAIAGVGLVACAAVAVASRRDRWSGPADRVTLARTVLVGGCATVAVMSLGGLLGPRPWWLVGLALPALLLDGLDGYVARRTGTATAAGARLDMEVDAALILVLSLVAARSQGPWVLAIGLMRYAYVAAGLRWAWLQRSPRPRFSRKVIAVVQAVALLLALTPLVPLPLATTALALALASLVFSFARDVLSLRREAVDRHRPALADAQAEPVLDLGLVEPVGQGEGGRHARP
ncbi:CDP-alcohol phosphatidyltransferase family protein [Kineococcus rhizosphaerae]|uniref:Phosphatidylglycerophosphate synthase n=1 Tax=Kineococcus rhizosphaerae TaxID=559628 RepID=A0A2T0RAE1_9ACTN|nr:phosphatidylglycerophosphate synthase [Kineococcus rhizosphaerae]